MNEQGSDFSPTVVSYGVEKEEYEWEKTRKVSKGLQYHYRNKNIVERLDFSSRSVNVKTYSH